MDQITIAGQVFHVPVRYEEGHELLAGEASALNQTYHENLRNNFATRVKEGLEGGKTVEALQTELDAYAESYQFGVRTGGGAVRDPVTSEALRIAKEKIREYLKSKGVKGKDMDAKVIGEKAKQLIEKDPKIMELAKKRVAETAAATSDIAALIADLPTATAA
jgi:hypothetical protein